MRTEMRWSQLRVPFSPVPAGTVSEACGSPWDQLCHFRREGDPRETKDFLPMCVPWLRKGFGAVMVPGQLPGARDGDSAHRASSVFASHSLRAGFFLVASYGWLNSY